MEFLSIFNSTAWDKCHDFSWEEINSLTSGKLPKNGSKADVRGN